jgi:hypothetical protein
MCKFDDIWRLAADKKSELQGSATPQEICTTIAKELFNDRWVETQSYHLENPGPDILYTAKSTIR